MNRSRIPLASAFLLLGAAWSAFGQQDAAMTSYSPPPPGPTSTGGKPPMPAPDFAQMRGALKVRGSEIKTRDALYPGEPALVGLAQSPAEIHASLGLDVRAKKPDTADQEDLHRRTLALYGDRSEPASSVPRKSAPPRAGGGSTEGGGNAIAWWLGCGVAAAAAAGLLIRRMKQRPVTD